MSGCEPSKGASRLWVPETPFTAAGAFVAGRIEVLLQVAPEVPCPLVSRSMNGFEKKGSVTNENRLSPTPFFQHCIADLRAGGSQNLTERVMKAYPGVDTGGIKN